MRNKNIKPEEERKSKKTNSVKFELAMGFNAFGINKKVGLGAVEGKQ